jgi:hypothetical protein
LDEFLSRLSTLLRPRIRDITTPVNPVKLGLETKLHTVGVGWKGLDKTKVEQRSRERVDALTAGRVV